MLKKVSIYVTAVLVLIQVSTVKAQNPERFFPKSDLMTVGSYYYPEQWPRAIWERDIKNIAATGFDFTHFGEFAWAFVEPEDGKFDFKWLDEAVAIAHKNGIKVIMCTSSPTPPIWLAEKHPEILMVNEEGRTTQHGSRQHISWSSPVYRKYVTRMVEAMAKHYAKDTRIWGWQLDNEPSHYGKVDHSPAARASFQKWLKKKYKTIDALNTTWGNAFWSIKYDNFEQIRTPNSRELIAQPNPHAVLDFKRFNADEVADFMQIQYDVLRKYIPANQWITTNLMAEHSPIDPNRMSKLDFLTYTKYLVTGHDEGLGDQGFRMGAYTSIAFPNDLFRSLNGVSGVMELQPGQVNWGRFNPQTMPGVVRMWIWHAFAGGNKFVCNYRFKQPLTGGEQYHYGVIGPDGVTPSTGGLEYIKVNNEIKTLRRHYDANAQMPADYKSRLTGVIYSFENRWEQDNQRQTFQWDYFKHWMNYYKPLKQFGAPVDIISDDKDFSKYRVLIAPAFQLLDAKLVERWKQYVEQGGHLVLSTRTGQKDRNAKIFESPWTISLQPLLNGKVSFYDHLPDNRQGTIKMGSENYTWNNWADIMEASSGVDIWATFTNQYYAGKPAVIHRKLGKGSVTYVGPDTDNGTFEKEVLKRVYKEAGIPISDLPEGVLIEWREGFWVGVNYSDKPYEVPVPNKSTILIGDKLLDPADVIIWKD